MGRRGRDKIFAPQRHARYIGSYRREDVSMLSPFRLPPHGAAKRPAERSRAATQRAMGYFPPSAPGGGGRGKGGGKKAEPRPNGRWVTSRLGVKGKRGGFPAEREGGGETKFLRLKVLPAISVVIAAGLCRCFPHFAPRRTPRTRLMAACLAAERKWSFRTLFICGVLVMTG